MLRVLKQFKENASTRLVGPALNPSFSLTSVVCAAHPRSCLSFKLEPEPLSPLSVFVSPIGTPSSAEERWLRTWKASGVSRGSQLSHHIKQQADITIAVRPVPWEEAPFV